MWRRDTSKALQFTTMMKRLLPIVALVLFAAQALGSDDPTEGLQGVVSPEAESRDKKGTSLWGMHKPGLACRGDG